MGSAASRPLAAYRLNDVAGGAGPGQVGEATSPVHRPGVSTPATVSWKLRLPRRSCFGRITAVGRELTSRFLPPLALARAGRVAGRGVSFHALRHRIEPGVFRYGEPASVPDAAAAGKLRDRPGRRCLARRVEGPRHAVAAAPRGFRRLD